MSFDFYTRLTERKNQNLFREFKLATGIDFSSNDYLGLSSDQDLQRNISTSIVKLNSGSTGSRLLRGHSEIFSELEATLATFSKQKAALFISSGYQANLALLSAVLDAESIVFSDQQNHASIIDGISLSKCEKKIFNHNCLVSLETELSKTTGHKKIVVVESVYSMSGNYAPLVEIADLCETYGAQLIVDEAHATGLWGAGRVSALGLEDRVLATVHTAGKSLAASGAWIAGSDELIDFIVNFSRPFIYSTAPSPLLVGAVRECLKYYNEYGQNLAKQCLQMSQEFLSLFPEKSREKISGNGPVFYVCLGTNEKALKASRTLIEHGFDVRAIRYPTVAPEQAGLRVSIHANQKPEHIRGLVDCLQKIERGEG